MGLTINLHNDLCLILEYGQKCKYYADKSDYHFIIFGFFMLPFFRNKAKRKKHNMDKQNNILLMMIIVETKPSQIHFHLGQSERIFERKQKQITLKHEQ